MYVHCCRVRLVIEVLLASVGIGGTPELKVTLDSQDLMEMMEEM